MTETVKLTLPSERKIIQAKRQRVNLFLLFTASALISAFITLAVLSQ